MKLFRIALAALVATLAVVASSCGGGSGVPADAVAVVDGTEISRAELDELVERAKKTYEAQKQEFPKVGTPEYRNVQTQYVALLVQREAFEIEAEKLGVKLTETDVDEGIEEYVKGTFEGDRKKLEKALEEQNFTMKAFRDTIRTSILAQKLYTALTKDVKVDAAEIAAYYQQNLSSYGTPESRDVRHILIGKKKGESQEIDFEASKVEADRLYAELQAGADFDALAKEHSDDPSVAQNGGKLSITRGQTVPEFEKTSFELEEGVVSKPVRTTYGYHLIEALSPVRKATQKPLEKVRPEIKATLLQQKKTDFITKWVEDLRKEYEDRVTYASGFEPPELPEQTETESATE